MEEIFLPEHYFKPIVISALGGLILNFMNLYGDTKKTESERVQKDMIYWIFFLFWPTVGGFLSFLYLDSGNIISPFLAFHIGLSSPVLLQSLIAASPLIDNSTDRMEN